MQAKSWKIIKNYSLKEMNDVKKSQFWERRVILTYSCFNFSHNHSIRNADGTASAAAKKEAQFRDFSIAAFKELVYAPGNEVFVYLELNALRISDIVWTPSTPLDWLKSS